MSNDPTITISIGVPNSPEAPGYLKDYAWDAFKNDVRDTFRTLAKDRTLHFRGGGFGQYVDATGVRHDELSYTVVFTPSEDVSLDSIRRNCAFFAREYGQECVALTIGTTELVGAERR